jgi:hypothetical protein
MDVNIVWSEEDIGYGVVYFSNYAQAIVTLIHGIPGSGWAWESGSNAYQGFETKTAAQQDALEHFTDGRSNYYEFRYGITE